MNNQWSEREARSFIARYARRGINKDRALRVYSSRLLGNEPRLVLHGGGNTSVKTTMNDVFGDSVEVLCVKGSGWDMGDIEPEGLPAVRLENLRRLASMDALSDADMVNAQRANLLDSTAPNPSVETLLHAFLPHKFIDHTHANAVLALTDQPDGEALCARVFGKTMGLVPYIMPGFALAKKALEVYREAPDVEGLVLLKHGIFTFGDTARDAYDRMIDKVTRAEKRVARGRKRVFVTRKLPSSIAGAAEVAPILRGLVSTAGDRASDNRNMLLEFRTSPAIRAFVDGKNLRHYSQRGTATPDHVIRTKQKPLIVAPPVDGRLHKFAAGARSALDTYKQAYRAYFQRQNSQQTVSRTELDPLPRLILVPGLGLFGLGASAKAASIAADLAETNIEVITGAESMSRYEVIPERDVFDIEYWSLEQAKLGKTREQPLARRVALVTGGGSGIGAATARAFAAQGAAVAVLDIDEHAASEVAGAVGGLGLGCDVTSVESIRTAFSTVCERYGGVDIVVSNAGAAWQGKIGTLSEQILRDSFELNFWAHQRVAQAAVAVMQAQGTGGCLLFNTSKQAINPGPDFGPYGLPKAATLFLMRQYALDHGSDGIRANAVNADRVRSGLLTDTMVSARAKARGVTDSDYMSGNLLGREVLAEDVARAFVDLALAEKTTGAITTVDGGNIAAALR